MSAKGSDLFYLKDDEVLKGLLALEESLLIKKQLKYSLAFLFRGITHCLCFLSPEASNSYRPWMDLVHRCALGAFRAALSFSIRPYMAI
jgi:hypothetical protein